MLDQANKVY